MNRKPAKPIDFLDRGPGPLLKRCAELLDQFHPNIAPDLRQGAVATWWDAMPGRRKFLKKAIANFASELEARWVHGMLRAYKWTVWYLGRSPKSQGLAGGAIFIHTNGFHLDRD